MASKIKRLFVGEPSWADYLFRPPPKHPDARMVYLGGCGLITLSRGIFYLTGQSPNAALFQSLGQGFVLFWSIVWVLVGLGVVIIAATGHRWPSADRVAAFAMLMLWWVWGVLFLVSGIFYATGDRARDFFSGLTLLLTGIIIAAGVVQGLRKTHEIRLREIAVGRIRELEETVVRLNAENEVLRERDR